MSAVSRFWNAKILPRVPHVIRHDFWRKLFALVIAVSLTIYAHQNTTQRQEEPKQVPFDSNHVKVLFVAGCFPCASQFSSSLPSSAGCPTS